MLSDYRYISTFPLLCLAANYSERVYTKPDVAEKETHIEAGFRMGTKAMVIKSVPLDDMATIVFAVRGSASFMDWVTRAFHTLSTLHRKAE